MPIGSWVSINTSRNAMDAPISQDWGNDVVNDLNYLYTNSLPTTDADSAPIIPNGSFEVDTPGSSPQTPSGWTSLSLGTNATGAVSSASQYHGAQSYAFTRDSTPGHNGGVLTTGYLNVSPSMAYDMIFMNYNTGADVENQIVINWFTASKSPISSTVVYDSGLGSNAPTVWTAFKISSITPPANAVLAQVVINAGIQAQTPVSTRTMYFDGLALFKTCTPRIQVYTQGNNVTVPAGCFWCEIEQNNPKGGGDWGSANNTYFKAHFPVTPGSTVQVNSNLDAVYNGTTYGFNSYADVRNVYPIAGQNAVVNTVALRFYP
jgi:hypothetical protein